MVAGLLIDKAIVAVGILRMHMHTQREHTPQKARAENEWLCLYVIDRPVEHGWVTPAVWWCESSYRPTSAIRKLDPLEAQAPGALLAFDQCVGPRSDESGRFSLPRPQVVKHSALRCVDVVLAVVAGRANKFEEILDAARVEAASVEHQPERRR